MFFLNNVEYYKSSNQAKNKQASTVFQYKETLSLSSAALIVSYTIEITGWCIISLFSSPICLLEKNIDIVTRNLMFVTPWNDQDYDFIE